MPKNGVASRALLLFFCAIALHAEAIVTVDSAEAGVEICRFRSGGDDDPFSRWLYDQELACGSSMSFPEGRWNVFARSGSGVSLQPLFVDGDAPGADASLRLAPAATLALQLAPAHSGVVYVPKFATAFPASERMSIPAGEELWLIVLEDGNPTGVITIPPTGAGATRAVDARDGGEPAILAWLEAPAADRRALENASSVTPPHLLVDAAGHESAVGTLPASAALDGAMVLAQRVADGPAELRLSGRGWLPSRQRFLAGPDRVTLVHQPIALRASATLTVNWTAQEGLPELDASLGSCDAVESPSFTLTLSACGALDDADEADESSCMPIHKETLSPLATVGSATIDEVTPGFYRAELRFGKLPVESVLARVAPLQQRPITVQMSYSTAHGSLTRGGEPLGEDAMISFDGVGTGFAPHGDGEYLAVLNGRVETDARIAVESCEGERAFVFADEPLHPFRRFNIDIPDNTLTISVIDTFTRELLRDATLRYSILSRGLPRTVIASGVLRGSENQDDASRFVMDALPERQLEISVSHPGYRKQQLAPFSMTKSEKKTIEVQLVPLRGSQGKIDSVRPFEEAMVLWYSAEGFQTERADLEPDGTFFYEERHEGGETMAIVSASHPLWITRAPVVDGRRALQLRFPDNAPIADVTLEEQGLPRLSIGHLTVPAGVLRAHLRLRNMTPPIDHIPALANTGGIELLSPDR